MKGKKSVDMEVDKSPDNLCNKLSKEPEEQLLNLELPYYQAIENTGGVPYHLIFSPEFGEGYYLHVGEGIKQLLNIEPVEFNEKLFLSMIQNIVPLIEDIPFDPHELREKFISGNIKSYNAEVLIMTPAGEEKWLRDSSLPLTDEFTGKVIGSFGILFDISDRKQTLVNLKRANEMAEESDRLKSAFLHNISHEIRTPLNAIVGFSTLLGEPGHNNEQRQEFLEILTRSTDHLLDLINDIVEISKIEAQSVRITRKEVNLNSILRKVFERFFSIAGKKKILLSLDIPEGEGEVIITDSFKLQQILNNLIGNALKFTTMGKVCFGYRLVDGGVEFNISDTGIGIPAEHHNKIFSRFYQAESSNSRSFEGTGLGLTISKAYVELLGGRIWFTSQSGKGSVFYFTLPCQRV